MHKVIQWDQISRRDTYDHSQSVLLRSLGFVIDIVPIYFAWIIQSLFNSNMIVVLFHQSLQINLQNINISKQKNPQNIGNITTKK